MVQQVNMKDTDAQLISSVVDELYDRLTKDGAFKHREPSEETKRRFDSLEQKIDTLSDDLHDEVNRLTEKIDEKAPKSWLHWLWGLLGVLVFVMTGLMGAQYSEIRKLNENVTMILIENATTKAQVEAGAVQRQRTEEALTKIYDELRRLEVAE